GCVPYLPAPRRRVSPCKCDSWARPCTAAAGSCPAAGRHARGRLQPAGRRGWIEGKTQILCALRKATYNRHSLKGLNKPPGVEMQRYASPSSARGSPLYCCLTVQLRGLSVAGATAPCRTVVWHDICPLSWQVRCMPQAAL